MDSATPSSTLSRRPPIPGEATRPEILLPCFAPLSNLPRIGPQLEKILTKLAGPQVADLLWLLPQEIIDRRRCPTIAAAEAGRVATVRVRILRHQPPSRPRRPYRVLCGDDSGTLTVLFFRADAPSLSKRFPPGETRVLSGRVVFYDGQRQMAHPDYVTTEADAATIPALEPVYPLLAGVTAGIVRRAARAALDRAPALPEWLTPEMRQARGWPAWRTALRQAHAPTAAADLAPTTPARQRLAYDELLADQLALALSRAGARRQSGRAFPIGGPLRQRALEALPFTLTAGQRAALAEIDADMAQPTQMVRLLQGDVGSGKTIVALLAMLNAAAGGAQAALMAPAELLARQHHSVIASLAAAAGLTVTLLTGGLPNRARRAALQAIASGEAALIIGTHALFQDEVRYHDLGLAVVDEQHRFGVQQRLALTARGRTPDLLVTTATPIPRTLRLTAHGDLDVSLLRERPPGRRPTRTVVIDRARLEDVIAAVGRQIDAGARVYWVCPLLADSENADLMAAEHRHAVLSARFGAQRVALAHGRMSPDAREAAFRGFTDGATALLVATTVIEVGVDAPAATIMVIEHAERFGLAQLHQLRGRVGRGAAVSTCILLRGAALGATAQARLRILRHTDDGFAIAEEDLRLRGAGEVLGTRQSGVPGFRMADLEAHGALLEAACADARHAVALDPDLSTARGAALRLLLFLFRRDSALEALRSG